jgi:hypothetical protein
MITAFTNLLLVVPMSLPPGTGKLSMIVGWVTALVGLGLFIAFCLMMGKTGFEALRHGRFEGGMGAAIVLVAAVFLGAAGTIFGALGITTV